jgi:hypothetical protein
MAFDLLVWLGLGNKAEATGENIPALDTSEDETSCDPLNS